MLMECSLKDLEPSNLSLRRCYLGIKPCHWRAMYNVLAPCRFLCALALCLQFAVSNKRHYKKLLCGTCCCLHCQRLFCRHQALCEGISNVTAHENHLENLLKYRFLLTDWIKISGNSRWEEYFCKTFLFWNNFRFMFTSFKNNELFCSSPSALPDVSILTLTSKNNDPNQ